MRAACLPLLIGLVASGAVLDRIAVVVGSDVITEGEVIDELRLGDFVASKPVDLSPEQRRLAADRLVDQQLIRREMEAVHYIAPADAEADAMLRRFRQQHFRSDAEYRAALEECGISESQLKQYLLWQLTVIRFTDQRFALKLPDSGDPSANRAAPGSPATANENDVDGQMEAWLKEVRSSTRIVFKNEAFQ